MSKPDALPVPQSHARPSLSASGAAVVDPGGAFRLADALAAAALAKLAAD